jgi:NADPH2:quinone reductase
MRAVRVLSQAGPSAVRLEEVPEPAAGPGDVVIDVGAAGVVFPDVLRTRGEYQDREPLPFVLGQECAGLVRSAPAGSGLRPGDRVAAFSTHGAFAEVTVVPAQRVFPLPDTISFDEGAALPVNHLTAHFALHRRGGLRPGETVLVHGAGGGVGSAAVQLAVLAKARVLAVVSGPAKAAVARACGAHEILDAQAFREQVATSTGDCGVDVIVDPVGGDRTLDSLRCLAPEGRLLTLGFTAGTIPEVRLNRLLLSNTSVVGVGWGAVAFGEQGYARDQWDELLPHLRSRELVPHLSATFPLADAAKALRTVDERRVLGKVVLHP